ncbi:hypothetical protein AB833_30200 [Chromatiales bacterium (ex Bugula neritina AB1)]|nr:hypothetical protein AB833_30200 [Chromatiales bacterium (ex Bugula neritina AB1)]
MTLPAFLEVDEALVSGGSVVRAAECHGVLCGILCASGASDMQGWVRYLFEQRDENSTITEAALQVLHDVHQSTLSEINHENLEFSLLLPSDDELLAERLLALSDWCSGYSLGLSMGGLQEKMLGTEEAREFLQDLQHIAAACSAAGEDSEDQTEESLSEIQEYIRMGVLLLNEELQPLATSPTLH